MNRIVRSALVAGSAALVVISLGACGAATATETEQPAVKQSTSAPKAKAGDKKDSTKPAEKKASLTTAQKNAVRTAESYIEMSGFSKKGLIEQLKFEDYSKKDAQIAVDSMKVSWNEEAEQSAESYTEMSGFSRKGLIDQLKFEGYTTKQATHGADSVDL